MNQKGKREILALIEIVGLKLIQNRYRL